MQTAIVAFCLPRPGNCLRLGSQYLAPSHRIVFAMSPDHAPIDGDFYRELETAASQRRRVALQYFNDLRQLCLDSGVIEALFIREQVEFMRLKSGEEIRLDHVIRLDDRPAPAYANYPDFSCGC